MIEISHNEIPVLIGPTASGKTSIALELAETLPIEIISADSRQIYKYMDIGTAKPTKDELAKVKHHMIDILYPNVAFSAGKFADETLLVINNVLKRNKIPLIVGGTGFYIKAFFDGLSDEPENQTRELTRANLNKMLADNGREYLYKLLSEIDPVSAEKNKDMNPQRMIRSIEYYYSYGIKFSESAETPNKHNFIPKYFGLFPDRETLYKKINSRVDKMIDDGLIDEVRYLLSLGYDLKYNSMNTVGYREIISQFNGEITHDQSVELIKRNSRRYAKRQFTWFNKIVGITDVTKVIEPLKNHISSLLIQ